MIAPPRSDHDVSARVRLYLQQTQPARPDLATSAVAINMAASTSQRHLAAERTSFQVIKDELRRDVAIVRLNASTVPLEKLAYELGCANSAAIQRAFKIWTGSAQGSYRKR